VSLDEAGDEALRFTKTGPSLPFSPPRLRESKAGGVTNQYQGHPTWRVPSRLVHTPITHSALWHLLYQTSTAAPDSIKSATAPQGTIWRLRQHRWSGEFENTSAGDFQYMWNADTQSTLSMADAAVMLTALRG